MGGGGGSSRKIGTGGVSHSQSHTTACQIEESVQFQESGFILLLNSEIERQIQSTGIQVKGSSLSGSNGFEVEDRDGKLQGKVELTGERKESYYIVTIKIDENNQ